MQYKLRFYCYFVIFVRQLDIQQAGKTVVMVIHNYNLLKEYPFRTLMCENEQATYALIIR